MKATGILDIRSQFTIRIYLLDYVYGDTVFIHSPHGGNSIDSAELMARYCYPYFRTTTLQRNERKGTAGRGVVTVCSNTAQLQQTTERILSLFIKRRVSR